MSIETAQYKVQPPPQKKGKLRWVILGMTALVLVLNYADRAALGVAGPHMIKELGMTSTEFGLVASAFFFSYAPFSFIGGWLSDKYGPRNIMGIAVAWWSLFTGLTALGSSFTLLFLIRLLFGFGEGPQGSVSTKTMHNWFPQRQMSTAMGLAQGATPLGGAIGTPLVVALISVADWRWAFVVLGLLGIFIAIGWFIVVRDTPEKHPWATQEDIAIQQEKITAPITSAQGEVPPLRFYFRMPLLLATSVAFFGYGWVLFTFLTWFPIYLSDVRGVDLKGLAFAGALPWIFGVVGFAGGGILSDFLARRSGKPIAARAMVIVSGLIITSILFAFISVVSTTISAVLLMSGVVFSLYITGAQYFAIIGDVVPSQRLGGVMGFVHGIANLSGILSPIVAGAIIDHTGNWAMVFITAAGICLLGSILVSFFGRERTIDVYLKRYEPKG
ncbi:MFS transporter [Paramixta manurensis]|uniref:MFS transporter n=1 Tax=Paramixta manurensis TaxID=2740817 RepID=A0A6M8UDF6_9GAMM|nr:MFS transporter [Erwiniaceae bacterium PD-1]